MPYYAFLFHTVQRQGVHIGAVEFLEYGRVYLGPLAEIEIA